jgi:hypothetical protein
MYSTFLIKGYIMKNLDKLLLVFALSLPTAVVASEDLDGGRGAPLPAMAGAAAGAPAAAAPAGPDWRDTVDVRTAEYYSVVTDQGYPYNRLVAVAAGEEALPGGIAADQFWRAGFGIAKGDGSFSNNTIVNRRLAEAIEADLAARAAPAAVVAE